MDKYLVPIFTRQDIEQYADRIWAAYPQEPVKADPSRFPLAPRDAVLLHNPLDLAARLGLTVRAVNLFHRPDTRSLLFYHQGTVLVQPLRQEEDLQDPDPVEVTIPAMTIVINTPVPNFSLHSLAIYHECIHFLWHSRFFRLQSMHHSDVYQLAQANYAVVRGKQPDHPTFWMEHQAVYGSYALLLPAAIFHQEVRSRLAEALENSKYLSQKEHEGMRLHRVGYAIAEHFLVSRSAVRARLLQLGYSAAIGALNYVDGHYITPFACGSLPTDARLPTYAIDHQSVARLYREDAQFRALAQSGEHVWADGLMARNDPSVLVQTKPVPASPPGPMPMWITVACASPGSIPIIATRATPSAPSPACRIMWRPCPSWIPPASSPRRSWKSSG